ncbi:MAG: phage terminase large subunit [Planctomycetes bacterium]|nr:phage terminase large subunit [Planctomycetota bacterium]
MPRPDYRPVLHSGLSDARRSLGANSLSAFAQIYLDHYCTVPFSRMHLEMFEMLEKATTTHHQRMAIAAPRGHAKSTLVSLAYVLWCVLYGREKFVLIVSATREQAVLLLKAVRDELQTNARLLADFPEACYPPGARPAPKPWKEHQIVLRNGTAIRALGALQGLRGMKHNQHRPGLIIADDLESTESVLSEEQRDKLRVWFNGTLLNAVAPHSNVIVVGTVLHHDSLLANLTGPNGRAGWTRKRYRAIERFSDRLDLWDQWSAMYQNHAEHNGRTGAQAAQLFYEANCEAMLEGSEVLWAEREDYLALMVMREREGRASFQSEKQNDPLDSEQCIFAETNLHFWDDEYEDVRDLRAAVGEGIFYGACDPSVGRNKTKGDYSAIIILYQADETEINYVIHADIGRWSPEQTIQRIAEYAGRYDFEEFVIETNNFQNMLADELEKKLEQAGLYLELKRLNSTRNKQARISAMEPAVAQGRIRFCSKHRLLLEQLRAFPLGTHDDGPDALEMVAQVALDPGAGLTVEPL